MLEKVKEILKIQDDNLKLFEEIYTDKLINNDTLYNLLKDCYTLDEKQDNELKSVLQEDLELEENEDKITIMINTYNRLSELKECLNSIFMQTYTNFEILIMDDNSKDGTEEYCRSIEDARVKYFRNTSTKGQAYGKKQFFNQGTGKYLIFCDDDDYYLDKEFFSKAVKILNSKTSINYVCANSLIKYEDKNKYEFEKINFKNMISAYEYLADFQTKYIKPSSTFPTMFRRKTLLKKRK